MNLKFSGRAVAFLSHYMAQGDIRYYLNGIYLAPMPGGPGVIGAATNGHVLGMWRDPDGHIDRAAILSISKGLASAFKKHDTQLENRDGRLTCVQYKPQNAGIGEEIYVQPNTRKKRDRVEAWEVEGKYPEIARVAPKIHEAELGMTALVNAKYLGLVAKSLPDTSKYGNGVMLRQVHKDGAILVLCERVPEAVAVIMPMRGWDTPTSPWLENWRSRTEAAENAKKLPTPGSQPSDAVPPRDFKQVYVPKTSKRGAA